MTPVLAAVSRCAVAAAVGSALVALAGDALAQQVSPGITTQRGASPEVPGAAPEPVRAPILARVVATVSSVVTGTDASTAQTLRNVVQRSLNPIRGCRGRSPGPVREERRTFTVRWRDGMTIPTPRDALERCVVNVLRVELAPAQPGATARLVVHVRYAPPGHGLEDGRCANYRPPGCRRTGCPRGSHCDTRMFCVPSACGCDPSTGRDVCSADCGGGVCLPDFGRPRGR